MNQNVTLPCLVILIGVILIYSANWFRKKLVRPLKILTALGAMVFIAGVIWLGYFWVNILIITVTLLGVLQASKWQWIERKLGTSAEVLGRCYGIMLVLLGAAQLIISQDQSNKTAVLTEKLTSYSGIHDIYPIIYFTEEGGVWFGDTKMISSTIPIMFQNPGKDPIRDLKITIIEVLELRKWNDQVLSAAFSRTTSNSHLEKDSSEKFIKPKYVELEYYFNIIFPGDYIDTIIAAPPTEGKNEYEYSIDVRTANWRVHYEYRFVKKPDISIPRFNFRNFYMTYEIWKVNMETGTKEELIDKYRELGFPDS